MTGSVKRSMTTIMGVAVIINNRELTIPAGLLSIKQPWQEIVWRIVYKQAIHQRLL